MRIAILHPTYWPEVHRGAERIVHDLGTGLAQRGHDVTVLTTHAGPTSVAREDDIVVARSRRLPSGALDRRGFERYVGTIPANAGRLLRGRFQIAHAFSQVDGAAAALAKRLGGPPLVLSMIGVPHERSIGHRRLRRRLLRRAVRAAGAVTVMSEAAADEFRQTIGGEPDIVPGAVRCADFNPAEPRADAPTLVCAATLNDPRKRAELLLRAFAALRRHRPDARLLLLGATDPQEADLGLVLPEGAERLHMNPTDALARSYGRAWASVLPSVDEAFGLVLIESLAAGTPVVAARSGACPEVVTSDAVGRLFDPDDEADLTRALDEALDLGVRRGTRDACLERARAFDWSRVLPQYEVLYRRVARG